VPKKISTRSNAERPEREPIYDGEDPLISLERGWHILLNEVIWLKEHDMTTRHQKNADPGGPGKEKKPDPLQAGDDLCRCKEASKMTPRQLLGLMISDLAFWKKEKKG
jgi:hypothetical protein